MQAFIYDNYGYKVDEDVVDHFEYYDWTYVLHALSDDNVNEIQNYDNFLKSLVTYYYDEGFSFIINRYGSIITPHEDHNVCMFAIKNREMTLNDFTTLHQLYQNIPNPEFGIKHIIELWENKIDAIEDKGLMSIKVEDYAYEAILECSIFALGLAENAVQYIREIAIDYPHYQFKLTLCHKRIVMMDGVNFFNPFNLIVDFRGRDYAEMYKNGIISISQLIDIIEKEQFDIQECSLLFSRLLFPTILFDCLEDGYLTRVDIRKRIYEYNENYQIVMNRIIDAYSYLTIRKKIRPIMWLNQYQKKETN